MNTIDRQWHDNLAGVHHRPSPRIDEAVDPQGEALILELRKLQRALDRDRTDEQRGPADRQTGYERASDPGSRKTEGRLRTRRTSVRRAFAVCLEKLGLRHPPAVDRTGTALKFDDEPLELKATRRLPPELRDAERQPAMPRADDPPRPPSRLHEFPDPPRRLDRDLLAEAGSDPQGPLGGSGIRDAAHPGPAAARPWSIDLAIKRCVERLRAGVAFLVDRSRGTAVASAAGSDFAERVDRAYQDELRTALRVLIISAGVLGSWATLVPLSGAVVMTGALVVESSVKKVQHPTGGVVADIRVHDGERVSAGELVVRLDETQVRASRQLLTNQLSQIHMRLARLVAERDGAKELRVPQDLSERSGDDNVKQLVTSETSLFNARASARRGQKELLQGNIGQFGEQIAGLEAQIKSKSSQLDLIASELTGIQELFGKGLVPLTRLTSLQRESARLEGERGQLTSAIAETKAKIGQAQLQIVQVDQAFRTEVMKDLREAQDSEAEFTEKSVAAQDQLDRIEIRAPTTGIVHQLSVHTIGGVIRPGDVIMQIVPVSDDLEIEARLPPHEIDQVRRGQSAFLRFSAFNQHTTPQVGGVVSYVSADLSHDPQTSAAYYTVRITLPGSERRRLNGLALVSGMPVEAFLQTGSRTMMSYLSKPITDQLHRMFNER